MGSIVRIIGGFKISGASEAQIRDLREIFGCHGVAVRRGMVYIDNTPETKDLLEAFAEANLFSFDNTPPALIVSVPVRKKPQ